ncbi:FecR domain-containing protein [bacterium]|nr:FecR domain-containing protein [bacterium]
MISSKFEKLCVKAAAEQLTEKERALLDVWMSGSEENAAYYSQIQSVWQAARPPEFVPEKSAEAAWLRMEAVLNRPRTSRKSGLQALLERMAAFFAAGMRPGLRPVMIGALLVIVAVGSWRIVAFNAGPGSDSVISTKNRQKTEMTLVDGSVVTLNFGSTLKYADNFGRDSREVHLDGEAYFSIVHNGLPFTVITRNARTTVLGTEFSVKSRGSSTRVIVREGRVRLEAADTRTAAADNVILTADQMSEIVGAAAPEEPVQVDAEEMLGWLDGRLVFLQTPLPEVLEDLEHAYDVRFVLADTTLENRTLTAVFEQTSFETVLSAICLTMGVQYDSHENVYEIRE